jgi:hypothetical protein
MQKIHTRIFAQFLQGEACAKPYVRHLAAAKKKIRQGFV